MIDVRRGDVVFLKEGYGLRFDRPYVIVSNDKNNLHSGMVLVVPVNGYGKRTDLPTHVPTGHRNDVAMCEHIRSVRLEAIERVVDSVEDMMEIDEGLLVALGLRSEYNGDFA